MKYEKHDRLTISMYPEIGTKLRKLATIEGKTLSRYVREALEQKWRSDDGKQ